MKVMVMIRADADAEAGVLPSADLIADMGRFNEDLVRAGVMLSGEGLKPSAHGARVIFADHGQRVQRGPFDLRDGLICGFWLWDVANLDEALRWLERCPRPLNGEAVVEVRPLYELDDFGDAISPAERARDERLRAELAARDKR